MRRRIFVFGSNMLGIHGAGAARYAADFCGAEPCVGEGLTGESYALPTCFAPGQPVPMDLLRDACRKFARFARQNQDMDFLLTAVGCGIAGFTTSAVFPLFGELSDNVYIQARLASGHFSAT